jgi:hypothetical protein
MGFQGTGGKNTVTRRTFIYRPATASASASVPSLAPRQTAKIYQFPAQVPARAAAYRSDAKIDHPERWANRGVMIEIGAAVLAFTFWLMWRLRYAFSPSH